MLDKEFLKIQVASVSDAKCCQEISRHFRRELPFVMLPQLRESAEKQELFVAKINHEIVGFARFHTRKDHTTTLYDLAVLPEFQKQGVGSALVFALPTPIYLSCTQENVANHFYRRLGFRLEGVREGKKKKLNAYRLDHLLVYVRGGKSEVPEVCRIAGIPYGVRSDYKAYDQALFLDIHWDDYDWNDYCHVVSKHHPIQALVADYMRPSQKGQMLRQIADLKALGVLRVGICPKFEEGIADIPQECVLELSVPSQYAGFLPNQSLSGRKLHLLGGHPDQWMYLTRYRYPQAHFLSMDGNIMGLKAGLHQYWRKGWQHVPDGIYANKVKLAAISFRNARRELFAGDLPRLVSSRRVLRCAVQYTPFPKPIQTALFGN